MLLVYILLVFGLLSTEAANGGETLSSTLSRIAEKFDNKWKLDRPADTEETLSEFKEIIIEFVTDAINKSDNVLPPESHDVCTPNPCGPGGQCTSISGSPICSCGKWQLGDGDTMCNYECTSNYNCTSNQTCINNVCKGCSDICGIDAICKTEEHIPVCACIRTGDPLLRCGCPTGFTQIQRSCYKLVATDKTHAEAVSACEALSASLIGFDSQEEYNEIIKTYTDSSGFWTNLYRVSANVWKWGNSSSALPTTFSDWASGHDSKRFPKYRCMHIHPGNSKGDRWHGDVECSSSSKYHYICKI